MKPFDRCWVVLDCFDVEKAASIDGLSVSGSGCMSLYLELDLTSSGSQALDYFDIYILCPVQSERVFDVFGRL